MPWYALTSRPQREFSAVEALVAYGFEAFTPTAVRVSRIRKGSKRSRKGVDVLVPMFRGYLFAEFDAVPWGVLRAEADTIRGIVSFDYKPHEISEAQIAAVRSINGMAVPFRHHDPHRGMLPMPGQVIDVLSGPFAGHRVRVTRSSALHIAAVAMILGANREIVLPVKQVMAS